MIRKGGQHLNRVSRLCACGLSLYFMANNKVGYTALILIVTPHFCFATILYLICS